jgi:hypothetical protein
MSWHNTKLNEDLLEQAMDGNPKESPSDTQADETRWGRVYAWVVGFTAVVILLLYSFSRHYAG